MRTRTVRVALYDGIKECKGSGCARRESRQSSMYVSGQILTLRCMTTFPLRGVPKLHNHEEGGSLGACTPELGGQDRHLGSKEQWHYKGTSPVYSKRIAMRGTAKRRAVSDEGPCRGRRGLDATPHSGSWSKIRASVAHVHSQSARAAFGRNSKHIEPVGTRSLGRTE